MASFKQLAESEQSLLTEAFNSKPYETTMTKKGAGDVFFTFEDEDGKEFRIQFYTSGGLGKQVRRVYVGEKQGNVYKDAINKFKNPLRVISTMIKATEDYLQTPLGKSIQGLAIDLSKKAAPKGVRLIQQIVKRSKVIRKHLDVIDSDLTVDPGRGVVWTVRKGVDPSTVYDGKKVAGLLGGSEPEPKNPASKSDGDEIETVDKSGGLSGVMAGKMFESLEPLLRQSLSFYGEWTFEDEGNMVLKGRFHGNGYEFRVGVNSEELKYVFEGSLYNTITPIVDKVKLMIEPIGGSEPEVTRGHDSSDAQNAVDGVMEGLINRVSEYVDINFGTKTAWSRDASGNMFKSGEIDGYSFNITIEQEGDFMWTVGLSGSKFGRSKLGSTQNFEALNIWKWFKQIKPEWADDVETMNDEVKISLGLSTLTATHSNGETIQVEIGTPELVASSSDAIKAMKAWEFEEESDDDEDEDWAEVVQARKDAISQSLSGYTVADGTDGGLDVSISGTRVASIQMQYDALEVTDIANGGSEFVTLGGEEITSKEQATLAKLVGGMAPMEPQKLTAKEATVKFTGVAAKALTEYMKLINAYNFVGKKPESSDRDRDLGRYKDGLSPLADDLTNALQVVNPHIDKYFENVRDFLRYDFQYKRFSGASIKRDIQAKVTDMMNVDGVEVEKPVVKPSIGNFADMVSGEKLDKDGLPETFTVHDFLAVDSMGNRNKIHVDLALRSVWATSGQGGNNPALSNFSNLWLGREGDTKAITMAAIEASEEKSARNLNKISNYMITYAGTREVVNNPMRKDTIKRRGMGRKVK
ncbi:hypothetical protein MYOV003v1_p0171 [Vibrio phage 207E48.1]|nr:hypothetical protein MYOV003v1_p0171 [Vibrio phage 207E48.1]